MYVHADLVKEVKGEIEVLRSPDRRVLHPDWITHAIFGQHAAIKGKDKEFFIYHAWRNLRDQVRKQLNCFRGEISLPGYDRVQQYYLVTRDDQQCAVHVNSLTRQELETKLLELRAMAKGCEAHEKELRRYWETKRAAQEGVI